MSQKNYYSYSEFCFNQRTRRISFVPNFAASSIFLNFLAYVSRVSQDTPQLVQINKTLLKDIT